MNIEEIITANRAVLHRMRDLNVRAGSDVFPIPSREELQRRFAGSLQGARKVSEITAWEALRLSQPDQSVVATILAKCPDTIDVFGRQVEVEYRPPYYGSPRAPRVLINFRYMGKDDWQKLPEDGICLPDGREVTIVGTIPGRVVDVSVEAASSQFKEQARQRLNQEQWDRWSQPSLAHPDGQIAPVVEREYGRCVLTDTPLVAYGTVRRSWSEWRTFWSRDRSEADQVRADSCRQYAEVQEETRRAELTKRLGELYKLHRDTVSEELRNRMYHAVYGYSRQSASEVEAIIADVEASLKPQTETDLTKIDMSQLFGGAAKVR